MSRYDIILRILVIVLALSQPIVILLTLGEVPSVSSVWLTYLQPLFIITNASTSYFLFSLKGWQFPSLFLLLLTAFSVDFNLGVHNMFAVMFFVSCIYSLFSIRRLWWYIIPYMGTMLVFALFGIFWGEFWAVIVICSYHFHALYLSHMLHKKRDHN